MNLEPVAVGTAVAGETVDFKAPPGGAELLELAASTDAELAGAAAAPGQAAPPRPPPVALEVELAGMFELMGVAAGQFLPSVGQVLDEARCKALGDALAPVVRKYGLERYLTGFSFGVELRALMVAGPIALALVAAVRHDIAAARAAQLSPAAPPAPAASSPPGPPPGALKPLDQAELDRLELAEMEEIHRELEARPL